MVTALKKRSKTGFLTLASFQLIGLLAAGTMANCRTDAAWTPPSLTNTFPVVEVIGVPGTTASASFMAPTNATTLWLTVSGLGYSNKASIQINLTGSWIPLNNQTCVFDFPGNQLNGIGGPLSTLNFKVPAANLKPGARNTVTFMFNSTDMISTGYRVLAINVLDATGKRLLPDTKPTLTLNSKTYTPADIAAGAQLWTNAPLKASWAGAAMQAKCYDCHAYDGSDLKYFGFSDLAIGERARFHGLDANGQRQIVAFIRNNTETPAGSPWDPPYQPGPGQSAKPYTQWAAGAGLKWVLPQDSYTMDYIFAGGSPQFSFTNTLNTRDIPIATPLPVWNEWLPRVSPLEAYGTSFRPLVSLYNRMLLETNAAAFGELMSCWMGTYVSWAIANAAPSSSSNKTDQVKTWSASRWMTVKTWEIMHTHRLEGRAQEIFSWPVDPHSWVNNTVFLSAPHFTLPHTGHILGDGTELTWGYRSHQWYWTMMVLNDSNHRRAGAGPVDWPYLLGFTTIPSTYGVDSSMQTILALAKSAESGTGDPGLWDDAFFGWAVTRTEFLDSYGRGMWQNYAPSVRDSIIRAFLTEYVRYIKQLGRNYFRDVTHEIADGETDNTPAPPGGGPWIKEHSSVMQRMAGDGVGSDIIDTMRTLAVYLWPDARW